MKCQGYIAGGKYCQCERISAKTTTISGWEYCQDCGHTVKTHSDSENLPRGTKVSLKPLVDTKREIEPKPRKYKLKRPKTVQHVDTVLTAKDARARLIAAGYEVGSRGRISPEQMAIASKL